jgi:hypothetical protein
MAIATTANFRYEVDKTIDKMFAFELARKQKYYSKIFTSKEAPPGEDYTEASMSALGLATTIGQGRRPNLDKPVEGNKKTRTYTKVGLSTQLTRELLQDDIHGKWKELPKQLVDSVIEKVEWDTAGVLYNGFSTSVGKDGLALFANNHVTLKGAVTINNLLAGDFSPGALEAAMLYGMRFKAQNGFIRPIKPKKVIVGSANAFLMAEIQKSLGRVYMNYMNSDGNIVAGAAGFADAGVNRIASMAANTYNTTVNGNQLNRMNPSNGIVDAWEGIVNPYLTNGSNDDDSWFVLFEGAELDLFWKWQPELQKDADEGTQSTQYFATARYAAFANNYEYMVGSAGL